MKAFSVEKFGINHIDDDTIELKGGRRGSTILNDESTLLQCAVKHGTTVTVVLRCSHDIQRLKEQRQQQRDQTKRRRKA